MSKNINNIKVKKDKKNGLKIFLIILAFVGAFSALCIGGLYYYKTEKQKSNEQITQFRAYLNEAIDELSVSDGIEYRLDEKYYHEQEAKTFVTACHIKEIGIDEQQITKNHILQSLENLFYYIPSDDMSCNLVQKPKLTLIEECTEIVAMNYLDYKYIGEPDEQLNQKSKGTFVYQNNPEFMNMPYGSSDMFRSGCGPMALTMAINYVKGKDTVLLEDVAKWAIDNDMYVENEGTLWSFMTLYPQDMGIECEEVYVQSVDEFEQILSEGEAMVTSMSKGHFTNNGHFITVISASDGKVNVLDSSSVFRSNKVWDSRTIFNESNKYFWVIKNCDKQE